MSAEVAPRFKNAPKRAKRGLDLESQEPLTRDEAEQLTANIAETVIDVQTLILRALAGRADKALGYPSWAEYVEAEFPQQIRKVARQARPAHVEKLRAEGKSLRAIASVLGVTPTTVRRDLSGVTNVTPDETVGIDGKTYPSSIEAVVVASPADNEPETEPPAAPESPDGWHALDGLLDTWIAVLRALDPADWTSAETKATYEVLTRFELEVKHAKQRFRA